MPAKTVLGYSGGLDTSVAIHWLKEKKGHEVVAVLVDVGQPLSNLEEARERARRNGASRVVVVDAKEEFASQFVASAIQANARYEGVYPLSTALARPLISKKLVEVAWEEKATHVAHGCTAKGNDQVRFELSIKALDPNLEILAPLREWASDPELSTREKEIQYARKKGIAIPAVAESKTFSVDENLWGRSIESGVLEDLSQPVPEEAFEWTVSPEKAPDLPEVVKIGFSEGIPTTLQGRSLPLPTLIQELNAWAGRHGVGRVDHVENRLVGIKSREVYEVPAATALLAAHEALEALTLPRDLLHFKKIIELRFSEVVYDGLWYSPLREALQSFVESSQRPVTGEVGLRLYKGCVTVEGRTSPFSLYTRSLATYDTGDTFRHSSAEGFIDIFGLGLRTYSKVHSGTRKR